MDHPGNYTPAQLHGLEEFHRQEDACMRAERWLFVKAVVVVLLVVLAQVVFLYPAHSASIPAQAQHYKLTLKREAQRVWGLQAPVASFAAQVHQESRWRENARSPVGAVGLTQFMPATAQWIGGLLPDLAERTPLNPTWALRALVVYDHWLWQRVRADNDCERMAFVLSAYNGGLGYVYKRQKRSPQPGICMGQTCAINPGITAANQAENAHYPALILGTFELLYSGWGLGACNGGPL